MIHKDEVDEGWHVHLPWAWWIKTKARTPEESSGVSVVGCVGLEPTTQ